MDSIEDLVGRTWSDLHRLPVFQGVALPQPLFDEGRAYVNAPSLGISIILSRPETVAVVQLYSEGLDGFSQFKGAIPGDVSFSMSRDDVRSRLGPPQSSGEEKIIPLLGLMGAWDAFLMPGPRLHVEYALGGASVRLFTLGPGSEFL